MQVIPEEKELLGLYGLISNELSAVEQELSKHLCGRDNDLSCLNDHILSLSGKRLRPAIVLLVAKMFDCKDEARIHLATSIELIHTATLLHDDVIDEARMRRFKESVNLRWGNKTAVLAGDAIFARAIYILANHLQGQVLRLVARSVEEVVTGEIEQMLRSYDLNLTEAEYLDILSKKTGSLISACTSAVAILASSCHKEVKALNRYGLKFGLGFQIIDDCLDLMGSKEEIGKEILNDKKQGRLTLPFIELKRRLPDFDPFDMDREEVRKLALEYGALDYALSKAKLYLDEAKGELEIFPLSIYRQSLKEIADYVGRRVRA